MAELTDKTRRDIVENKIALYRNSVYDHEVELRVMERVKDAEACKRIKAALVKFEHVVDELEKILAELPAPTPDEGKAG